MAKQSKKLADQVDGETEGEESEGEETNTALAVIVPTAKALQTEIGSKVLGLISNAFEDDKKAAALGFTATQKKNLAQSVLTEAVVSMCRADPRIGDILPSIVGDSAADKNRALDTIRIGIGLMELRGKAKMPTAAAVKYFGSAKEKKGTEAHKRHESIRTNFARFLRKAATAALGVLDMKAEVSVDEDKGTLQISGPGVAKVFGAADVILDERKDETLKAPPSIAEVRRVAERNRGIEHTAPVRTTDGSLAPEGDAQKAVQTICASLVASINRLEGSPDVDTLRSLKSAQSAIAQLIAPIVNKAGAAKATTKAA